MNSLFVALAYLAVTTSGAPRSTHTSDVQPYCGGVGDQIVLPQGNVYPNDPNDDTTHVSLLGLPADGAASALDGDFVTVLNGSGPNATPTTICKDFFYPPSSPHFGEVNVYYHASKFLGEFLPARGFQGLGYVLPIVVNKGDGIIAFDPSKDTLFFAIPNLDDPAYPKPTQIRDVIARETAHAVTASLGVGNIGSFHSEGQAMKEGLGDYWSAAFTDDPRIGEYMFKQNCSQTGGDWVNSDPSIYNYANFGNVASCQFPAGNDIANGMILTGALWYIRTHVPDPATADSLVLEALKNYFPHLNVFFAAYGVLYDAIRLADVNGHAGAHLAIIDAGFSLRGIHAAPSVGVSGPTQLQIGLSGTYAAGLGVTTIVPVVSYQWSKRHTVPANGDWVALGSGPSISTSDTASFEIRVTATDSFGRTFQGSQVVQALHGPNPTVSIQGATSADAYASYSCSTTATGVGLGYSWMRRDATRERAPGHPDTWGAWAVLPQTSSMLTVTTGGTDMQLRVTVTDIDGRTASADLVVAVASGAAPPAGSSSVFDLVVSTDKVRPRLDLVSPTPGRYEIAVCDVAGRPVQIVFAGFLTAGKRSFTWDSQRLPSGVYFCRAVGAGRIVNRRLAVTH